MKSAAFKEDYKVTSGYCTVLTLTQPEFTAEPIKIAKN